MAADSRRDTRWLRGGLAGLRALSPFALGLALSGPRPVILLGALAGLAGLALRRPYGGLALGLLLEVLVWAERGAGAGGYLVAIGVCLVWLPRPQYHLLAAGAFLAAGWTHYLEWSWGAAAVTLLGVGIVKLSQRRLLCSVSTASTLRGVST